MRKTKAKAGEVELDPRVKVYLKNRESLLRILYDATNTTTTRQLADKINEACFWYGYASGLSFTNLGDRRNNLAVVEKEHFIPTPTIAAYLACAVARYAPPPWAKDPEGKGPQKATADKALRQVYIYCLCGSLTPGADCDLSIIDKQPQINKVLGAVVPQHPEPPAKVEAITSDLRVATLSTLAKALQAIAENLQERMQRPVEEPEPEPCNDRCPLANWLRASGLAHKPTTEEDRATLSEGTGISLERCHRLLCGDAPTDAEIAAIESYGSANNADWEPGELRSFLTTAAAAKLNASHLNAVPSSTVGQP